MPAERQCPHYRYTPFVQWFRLHRHIQLEHPTQYQADVDALDMMNDPSVYIAPPPASARAGNVADTYERIFEQLVELEYPITSLATRITTSNLVEVDDYDSADASEEENGGDHDMDNSMDSDAIMMDVGEIPESLGLPASQHVEEFPMEVEIVEVDATKRYPVLGDLWRPFRSGYEFKMAHWMLDANVLKVMIDRFFNEDLARTPPRTIEGAEGTCFTSAHTLGHLLDDLDPALKISAWKIYAINHVGVGLIKFRYREIGSMIHHIFNQPSHEPYMLYKPTWEFSGPEKGYRLLNNLHMADWWWNMQVSAIVLTIAYCGGFKSLTYL